MKMYGKMLKKIFGAATVCVAFGATELKADFKTDLMKVCKKYGVDPKSKEANAFAIAYRVLYRDFKKEVVPKMVELRNSYLAEEKKIIAGDGVFLPGKSEIEMLEFAKWLWQRVKAYQIKGKEIINQKLKELKESKNKTEELLLREYREVFRRRMCNLSFVCIRFFAGRFALEEKLFAPKDCVSDFITDLHSELRNSVLVCTFRKSPGDFYKKLLKTVKEGRFADVLDVIIERCDEFEHYTRCSRSSLEKLSENDFGNINAFLKNVKDDSADELWKKYKFKQKIDFLEQDYKFCTRDLTNAETNRERLSAGGIDIHYEYCILIGECLYKFSGSERDDLNNRIKKLEDEKLGLGLEIERLKLEPYVEDRELIKHIFEFREYNATLRLFFYCHTLFQCFLEKNCFKDRAFYFALTDDFKEECDSMIKRFPIERNFPFERDFSAKCRAFSEDKEAPVRKFVFPNGKISAQKSFYNMQKNNNTTVLNKGFIEEKMNKSSLY